MGERTPVALLSGPAAGRLAVAEAITNILAAPIERLSDIKLSANWMCAAGFAGDDAVLYDTVEAVAMTFCPALGVTIPVGKDSMSMRTVWDAAGEDRSVTAPVSLIVSAFAPCGDVREVLTPTLERREDTALLLIDLGRGADRVGGSVLAQVWRALGSGSPDVAPEDLIALFKFINDLRARQWLLAYHDRSDGGLLVTLLEMAFAGRCGLDVDLDVDRQHAAARLFSEEVGAVIQVEEARVSEVMALAAQSGLEGAVSSGDPVGVEAEIAAPTASDQHRLAPARSRPGAPPGRLPPRRLTPAFVPIDPRTPRTGVNEACVEAVPPGAATTLSVDSRRKTGAPPRPAPGARPGPRSPGCGPPASAGPAPRSRRTPRRR